MPIPAPNPARTGPDDRPPDDRPDDRARDDVHEALCAAALVLAGRRVAALTGAGISTESGIPDYRGDKTRALARQPMRFATFAGSDEARRRYWARATLGWPRVRDALPNDAHQALAALEARGRLSGVITQNVDGLHHKARSRRVVELHGALREVICLGCGAHSEREALHQALLRENAAFDAAGARMAPDGDFDVDDAVTARFRVIACAACGGPLKPRVVFFGENVPASTVQSAWRVLDDADALLVVGSSLEVFSGRRFVEEAARRGLPVVIVNQGPTRSDALATVRIDGRAGALLPQLVA